jgi:hypothetical protein
VGYYVTTRSVWLRWHDQGWRRLKLSDRYGCLSAQTAPNPPDGRCVLVCLTPIVKELADDSLATLVDTQAANLGTLHPAERADLADLLRTLLRGLGETPAFRPAVAVQRG